MEFLDNLNYLLRINRMTKSDLAHALNIPASTITSWYNRSYDGLALKTAKAIASYFNVTLDALVYGTGLSDAVPVRSEETRTEKPEKQIAEVQPFTEKEIQQIKRLIKYAEFLSNTEGSEND